MDWTKFNNHGESNNHAFEVMCNLIFESWCRETYQDKLEQFAFVNGNGGDGGVEAYGILSNGNIVGVQSKWFPNKLEDVQIRQIENSFKTALKVRPNISRYIVCIPRDLNSKRIVKKGKKAKNTESDKWEEMVRKFKSFYPNVEIILWDESTIQEKITRPTSQGIYKYWFENTVLFDQIFENSYDKVIQSWGKLKYIPEIHTVGRIHKRLERFLGSVELTERRYKEICAFISKLQALKRSYEDLIILGIPETAKDLEIKIQKDLVVIKKWLDILITNKILIKNGGKTKFINKELGLICTEKDIEKCPLIYGKYFHFREAEKLLENIEDDFYELMLLLKDYDSNKLIFLGIQGTGKTAGMIAETAGFLQNRIHLPVIVHAKEFAEGETWVSIITKTLGLSTEWSEMELFGALQNAALLKGKNRAREFFVRPQCVIFVDGIDEAPSWEFWKNKIDETSTYGKIFPDIKFVFLSRPYVFENYNKSSYRSCFYLLPNTGDGDLEELCDKYFIAYNVDIGENQWIKNNLRSPMAVKLFCDIYRNQKISKLPQNAVILTQLYKAKIESLEESYNLNNNIRGESRMIQIALIELAELFAKDSAIQYQEIYNKASEQLKDSLENILDFLTNEGFIYTFSKQADEFSSPKTFYSWGMQPVFDYLIAQKMYVRLDMGEKIEIQYINGIYQMLSLISIEKGKLITEYPNIIIEDRQAFELICYALANCSSDIADKYCEYLKQMMRVSVSSFREIFIKVIQPVLRIERHPLGSILLDQFLREFDTSAERDIWWSIPAYLRGNDNTKWKTYNEMDFNGIQLKNTDKYYAAPLALAWSLSSVNNEIRQSSRLKLTKWGIEQPLEFWKLLQSCIDINDDQILEDIFAVAYGIALEWSICNDYLMIAADWILNNVFTETGLRKYENVVLRYYSTGIVKIAIYKGLLDRSITKQIEPPYVYDPQCLPLYKDALGAERMGGYEAIDYDLARYVLCDHFDAYFRINYQLKNYSPQATKFIEKYKTKYAISELKIEGLIIAMAYQYLLDHGWNKETFWSYKDKNKIGVDIAICRTHHPATHGQMSQIMTIAEKNVWLAKHQIEAVISSEIPLCEDHRTYEYVNDYSQIENFVNTYQDYVNIKKCQSKHKWFNTELLAAPNFDTIDKKNIEDWVKENYVPPFEKWFSEQDGNVILGAYTNIANDISGVVELVWISCGVVKKSDFPMFLMAIDSDFVGRDEMLSVSEFNTSQRCKYYCTPQEACMVHSDKEINDELLIPYLKDKIKIQKLLGECLSADELESEKSFTLPSKFTRELSGIIYGDGYSYVDEKGRIIARYSVAGENFGAYQDKLMIDNHILKKGLEEQNYKLFWLYRVYREPSLKARERYTDMMQDMDKIYVVWMEGKEYKYKELAWKVNDVEDQNLKGEYTNI